MDRARKYLTYFLVLLILFILGGFAGWYFFLRAQESNIASESKGRGLGQEEPLSVQTGSTYNNISQSVGGNTSGGAGLASSTLTNGAPTNVFGSTLGSLSQSGFSSSSASSIGEDGEPIGNIPPLTPRLWHAVKHPVAGYGFVGNASSTKLYFAERATGYVFSLDLKEGSTLRLTNSLTPKTYEAYFAQDGSVIERSLTPTGIQTFAGVIGTTTGGTTESLVGINLENNIDALSIDPIHNMILYSKKGSFGTTIYRVQWDGKKRAQLFTTAVGSWQPTLLTGGRAIISLKPSNQALGFAFEIQDDGTLSTLARNLPGLNILAQNNSNALLVSASADTPELYSVLSGSTTLQSLNIATVVDKCVWTPAPAASKKTTTPVSLTAYCAVPIDAPSNYPDAWYQGQSHTDDVWYTINVADGSSNVLLDARDASADLPDVQNPVIDPSGNYIAYTDAKDGSLWVMRTHQ